MNNKSTTRVPVVSSDGRHLMPTTCSRARKWIKSAKAIAKRSSVGVFYVQLTQEPSGYATQKIVAGVDRGKAFTGIAVQTEKATIVKIHACLPGFYKSKKTKKDKQSVTGKIAKRHELRRTRRGKRIDRKKPFKKRNHRQKRFSNRRKSKLSPSIKANREMELRILFEFSKLLPLTEIRDEDCGGKTQKNGFGISPVTVGENWFRKEASKIAPVVNVNSLDTGKYRNYLGLAKDKKDKSKQCPETHANDAISLCSTSFVEYKEFTTNCSHGHHWVGKVHITDAPFIVITRPKLFRRKLYQENYSKKGKLKRVGGTVTPYILRSGDRVKATKGKKEYFGWIGGYSEANEVVSVYDHNWKRLGQFKPNRTKLLNRSTKLCVVY